MKTGPSTKIINYRSRFFFNEISPGGLKQVSLPPQGTEPLQVTLLPRGLQSMRPVLVCAVMAHLEYTRHSCLDKACLVCLFVCACSLFLLLFFFYPMPCVKIFFPSSSLYLSVACLIDLFVSAPLMAPSFGSFVNTLGVIAILCETKKKKG